MKTSIKTALTTLALIEDGVATLFGWVDSQHTENAAKQAALSFDNVDSVRDLIAVSN